MASRKKNAIPKTGRRLAANLRGGRAVRESDATLLPADERSRPDSEVFFFIFEEVIGKKNARKRPTQSVRLSIWLNNLKSFACSLRVLAPTRDAIPRVSPF